MKVLYVCETQRLSGSGISRSVWVDPPNSEHYDKVIAMVEKEDLDAALQEIKRLKALVAENEKWEAYRLKESYNHANCQTVQQVKEKILPELWPTWEAGRACGFHAGVTQARWTGTTR